MLFFTLKDGRKPLLLLLFLSFLQSIYLCFWVALVGSDVPAALVFSECGLHAAFQHRWRLGSFLYNFCVDFK